MDKVVPIAIGCVAIIQALHQKTTRCFYRGLVLTAVLMLTGCDGGEPDEGGVIGSGVYRGAVSESAFASNNVIKVKSADGVLSEIAIDSASQYGTSTLPGEGPWVLGLQPGTDNSNYAIAYADGTRNVNRFSDLGLRNWYARQELDIDAQFSSSAPFTKTPTAAEYEETVANIFQLIAPVLEDYEVTGDDVISVDYIVNDEIISERGTDTFLKRNTVLVDRQEQGVEFLITDSSTTNPTQSQTQSSLTLAAAFFDNRLVPPSTPTDVKALGSDVDEIVVVWTPSSDDVAVLEYEVTRDGVVVATTPYPVYIDRDPPVGQSSGYQIVAIDSAGNRSDSSLEAFAALPGTNDATAPPAPTNLENISTTSSAVRVRWDQFNIGNVVAWNLHRSVNNNAPEILFRLTSNVAIDTAVIPGEEYCYQVEALNASGNSSELSERLCVRTTNPESAWNVPDIESLSCDRTLSNADIQPGLTTIPSGCYEVLETLRLTRPTTLKISKGTVLKFAQATQIIVTDGAALSIEGSLQEPVVLTGSISARGHWRGIEFEESVSPDNLISGAVIQYGGGFGVSGAFEANNSRFSMVDTLMRFNQNNALNLNFSGTTIGEFRGNRVIENDAIGVVRLDLVISLAGNNDFTGNIKGLMDVSRNIYTNAEITIPDLGVPLRWNGVDMMDSSLEINPGVELEMVDNAIINVDGKFSAVGTAGNPIEIRGGLNWRGIRLEGRQDKLFNHISIANGGDASLNRGAIQWVCFSADAASLRVDNAEISESQGFGILLLAEDGCIDEINDSSVIFFNNALGEINRSTP